MNPSNPIALLTLTLFVSVSHAQTLKSIIPNDPDYAKQWYLERICAPEAWAITTGSPNITVAVIDSGMNSGSPDFEGRLVQGYDFLENDNDTTDDLGHGTIVTGILSSTGDNNLRLAGIDWNCKTMPLRVYGWDANPDQHYEKAFNLASSQNVRVVNCSWSDDGAGLTEALHTATRNNTVIIASSGNENYPKLGFLAVRPGVIAVGASDRQDKRASYSNYGRDLDIVAPSQEMPVYDEIGQRDFSYGTSLAAPQVSGAASLILSLRPELSATAVEALLYSGADDIGEPGWDQQTGWGRLNLRNTLMLARCQAKIEISPNGSQQLHWEAPPNAQGRVRYRIHTSENLEDWQEVKNPEIQYTTFQASWNIPPNAPAAPDRFYKISVESALDLTPRVLRRDDIDAPIPLAALMAEEPADPFEPDPEDTARYQSAFQQAQSKQSETIPDYYLCQFDPAYFPFLAGYTRFGPKVKLSKFGERPFEIAQIMLTYGPDYFDEAYTTTDSATTGSDDPIIIDPIDPPSTGDPVVIPKVGDLISLDENTESFIARIPPEYLEQFQTSFWLLSITPLPTPAP